MAKRMLSICLVMTLALIIAFPGGAFAGNKQLMSEKMAAQDCKRNIAESIVGVKVKSESQMGLTDDVSYKIEQETAASLKGVQVQKMIYDQNKDIAFCVSYIDLGEIKNILGQRTRYKNLRLFGFGFGTMTPESRPPLMALRAALLNAYDEMAALVVGQKISGFSEAENFVLTKDTNKSAVCAAIYGAYIPDPDIDHPKRGWGWDEDGNAFVRLNLDLRKVHDILGKTIVYKGDGNLVEVIGRGSPMDELSGETGGAQFNNTTEMRNLDVPVAPQTVPVSPQNVPAAPRKQMKETCPVAFPPK